jgi:hypothetical protein
LSFPRGTTLIDVLVRPIGEILDLNSRFSGVWPRHFANAIPHSPDTNQATLSSEKLQMVNSPADARELLLSHLTTTTPLIGHAIDNDLNATRIVHPTIVDTVLLYPHPRGLPIRNGLKVLAKRYLDRDIQMGGANGHDSKEDALATGELVRWRIKEKWMGMQREGWAVEKGVFVPPAAREDGEKVGMAERRIVSGEKRKLSESN